MNTRDRLKLRRELWQQAKAGTLTLDPPDAQEQPESPRGYWWLDDDDDEELRTPTAPSAPADSFGPLTGGAGRKVEGDQASSTPSPPSFSPTQDRSGFDRGEFSPDSAAHGGRFESAHRCADCAAPLIRGGKRGRWPSRCVSCRRIARMGRVTRKARETAAAVCVHCGAEFERDHSKPGPAPKYCGRVCREAATRPAWKPRAEPLALVCASCGMAFASLRKRKYCGPKCWPGDK